VITPARCRQAGLTEREEYVILSLDGYFMEPKTHDSIGAILSVTRVRVEHIEQRAREKLAKEAGLWTGKCSLRR
jgi:DNA-directed RNA polymerase sigma subunit (sigma70/sigma32)